MKDEDLRALELAARADETRLPDYLNACATAGVEPAKDMLADPWIDFAFLEACSEAKRTPPRLLEPIWTLAFALAMERPGRCQCGKHGRPAASPVAPTDVDLVIQAEESMTLVTMIEGESRLSFAGRLNDGRWCEFWVTRLGPATLGAHAGNLYPCARTIKHSCGDLSGFLLDIRAGMEEAHEIHPWTRTLSADDLSCGGPGEMEDAKALQWLGAPAWYLKTKELNRVGRSHV